MKTSIFLSLLSLLLVTQLNAQNGKKFILFEAFSTAPCGFCPDGDLIAAKLVHDHPEIIWMTHHAGFGSDSMTIDESKTIAKNFTTFAPGACIDRMDVPIPVYTKPPFIAISRQKWDSVCSAHMNDNAVVDVSIDNQYDDNSRVLTCKVTANFIEVPASGDIRLNLFIVEDSVVGEGHGYDQKSYFNKSAGHPLYGMGDTIIGYVHHRIVRKSATGIWGLDQIIPNTPEINKDYNKSFTIAIPKNWKKQHLDVVAFVSYYDADPKKREVINSNHKILLDETSGNEDISLESINIYPNPVSDHLIIDQIDMGNKLVKGNLYDITGQDLKEFRINDDQTILNLNNLESGIYILKIQTEQGEFIEKIIKE